MSDDAASEIEHLQDLAATLRRRQRVLELQRAQFGEHVPAHIVLELEDVARQLTANTADLRRLGAVATGDNPYRGLLTFREEDFTHFFGRDALVNDLVERVRKDSFLAVLGASGSGKSSVVRAGMLPALKGGALDGSDGWRYLPPFAPGARPLDALAADLTKFQNGNLETALALSRQLAESDRALLLFADMLGDRATRQRFVLVVDQFEELWTLEPSDDLQRQVFVTERQRFLDLLLTSASAPDTPLLVVLAMRADFLHRAAEHPALARLIANHDVIVSPMSHAELRDAIQRPAELAGGSFEAGLPEELIAQVEEREGALPLLEYTLRALWQADDGAMTWATYRALGGVEGALAARADSILADRYTPEQRDELRHILPRLVQPGEGTADTRRRVPLAELVPDGDSLERVQVLLQPLVNERLLVTAGDERRTTNDERSAAEYDSGTEEISHSSSVEVAHEALIRAWPTLQGWVQESRAELRFQIQLSEDAQEWERSQRTPDLLWRGARLGQAEEWLARARPRLNERDAAFLNASRAAAAAEQQQRRRRANILWMLTAVACIAALIATLFGVQAQWSAERANRLAQAQSTLTSANDLAVQAQNIADSQQDLGLLLSLEANSITSTTDLKENLLDVLEQNPQLTTVLREQPEGVRSVAFSPDGTLLASGSNSSGTIVLWDVATHTQKGPPLVGPQEQIYNVVFSPDGKTLASTAGNQILLWNVDTPDLDPVSLAGHKRGVWRIAFKTDQILASIDDEGTIMIWNLATHERINTFQTSKSIPVIIFSPDKKY